MGELDALDRVEATEAAIELIRRLRALHGELMFHQSGGCCDGSSPMCYPKGGFKIGMRDVRIGSVDGCDYFVGGASFYMGGDQYERWQHTDLVLDVVPGRGAGFSLEAPEGVRFLIRSEMCAV